MLCHSPFIVRKIPRKKSNSLRYSIKTGDQIPLAPANQKFRQFVTVMHLPNIYYVLNTLLGSSQVLSH